MGNTAYVYLGMGSNVGMQVNLDLRVNGWGWVWGGVEVGRGEGGCNNAEQHLKYGDKS